MDSIDNQLKIYKLTEFFLERSTANSIVVLTDSPEEVRKQYSTNIPLIFLGSYGKFLVRHRILRELLSKTATPGLYNPCQKFLADKILVITDHLDNKKYPNTYFANLDKLSQNTLLTICTTSKNKHWELSSLQKLFHTNKTLLSGVSEDSSTSSVKDRPIIISGKLTDIYTNKYPQVSVLAIMPHYNEDDILEPTVMHLLAQGVDVHIIDNWSNDGSYKTVQELAIKYQRKVTYERFPRHTTKKNDWKKMLDHVAKIASAAIKNYQWIMLNSADEIRWSPWQNVTLKQAFSFIDSCGYNCVDYTVFDLRPVKDGFKKGMNPTTFFSHGEFGTRDGHFVQINSWKNVKKIDLSSTAGHHVLFKDQKVFPLKFFLSHYPLRSTNQARKKVFQDRIPRYSTAGKKRGWHIQYNHITKSTSFIYNKKGLVAINQKNFQTKYLLERISGIGIR